MVIESCHTMDYIHSMSNEGYPAVFRADGDGRYSVFFLGSGMEGCITYGKDRAEAERNAQEALDAYIGYLGSCGEDIPSPEDIRGEDISVFIPSSR